MSTPILMPKATAAWLIEHTSLTFQQIGDFCGLHHLEVQAIANSEHPLTGLDPLATGQLSLEAIREAEADSSISLKALPVAVLETKQKKRYTPLAKRQDKPAAIAWVLKNAPQIPDSEIVKMLGTTKNLINTIRSKTHWNSQNIEPSSPVTVGLLAPHDFDAILKKYKPAASVEIETEE
jgi:hypothetical protein